MVGEHEPDVRCPIHGTSMHYSKYWNLYACQVPTCVTARGLSLEALNLLKEARRQVKCWECIKDRHSLCDGYDDAPPVGTGRDVACVCSLVGHPSTETD